MVAARSLHLLLNEIMIFLLGIILSKRQGVNVMTSQHIVMNFTAPPTIEDLRVITHEIIDTIPDELLEYTAKLSIEVDDFPDEAAMQGQSVEDPFDLPVLYSSGKERYPGVEQKNSKDENVITFYRRPILDMWCENCDDLFMLIRQLVIEEFGRAYDIPDSDVTDMVERHHQRLL